MRIESRVGKIKQNDEVIFQRIADFNNINTFAPGNADEVSNMQADEDSCSFDVKNMGRFGMRIIEREPHKLVKISSDGQTPFKFTMWIQLKQVSQMDTRVKITLDAELNAMLKMMAKKPLTKMVDTMVDRFEQMY
jgi:carbon monoxide dehydrogenase subunit G